MPFGLSSKMRAHINTDTERHPGMRWLWKSVRKEALGKHSWARWLRSFTATALMKFQELPRSFQCLLNIPVLRAEGIPQPGANSLPSVPLLCPVLLPTKRQQVEDLASADGLALAIASRSQLRGSCSRLNRDIQVESLYLATYFPKTCRNFQLLRLPALHQNIQQLERLLSSRLMDSILRKWS